MGVFKGVDFLSDGVGRVVGIQRAGRLKDDFPFVVFFIHFMDRDARLKFSQHFNGFMHFHTIHSLAAKPGQQRRVYVDDTVRKQPDQVVGYEP